MAKTSQEKELAKQIVSLLNSQNSQNFAPSPVTQNRRGIEPTAFISEASGIGGAGIGAAIGALGGPIGSLVGAGLGGLIGGFGGSAAEQQIRDKKIDYGKAAKEGILEGVFSAGPLRLGKLGLAATKGVARQASGRAVKGGLGSVTDEVGRALESITSSAGGGILRKSTIAGKSELDSFADQANLIDLSAKFPQLRGSGFKKFSNVERVIGSLTDEVDNLLKGVPNSIPASRMQDAAQSAMRTLDGFKIGKAPVKEAAVFRNQFNKAIKQAFGDNPPSELTALDINKLRRVFNKKAARAFKGVEGNKPLSNVDQAILDLRDLTDELLEQVAPSNVLTKLRVTNNRVSSLIRGIPEFKKLSEEELQLLGTRIPVLSRAIPRGFQGTADIVGRGVKQGGSVTPGRLAARAGVGGLVNATTPLQQTGQGVELQSTLSPGGLAGQGNLGPEDLMSTLSSVLQPQQQSPLTADDIKTAILMDLQETGGENVEAIQLIGELYGPQSASQAPANITKVTAQQYGLAQTGMQAVDQLKQLLQSDPGVLSRTRTPGRTVGALGIGGTIASATGTGPFDALTYNIADTLLRLRTGAQANESEVRQVQSQIIPRAGDSPETVQLKLQQLEQAFSNVFDLAQASGTGGDNQDLANSLTTLLGAQ